MLYIITCECGPSQFICSRSMMYLIYFFFFILSFLTRTTKNMVKSRSAFVMDVFSISFIFLYKGYVMDIHLYIPKKLICLSQHFDYNILMLSKEFSYLFACLLIIHRLVDNKYKMFYCFQCIQELFDTDKKR